MREWLYHGSTCPLCRTRIRGFVTPQLGYARVTYLNAKGEEVVEESEALSEGNVQWYWGEYLEDSAQENEEEDELEEADPVVVAPTPTPEDTPNHGPSSRSTPSSITSEDSDEIDEESRSQECPPCQIEKDKTDITDRYSIVVGHSEKLQWS
jgi:hypothetical protein